MSKDDKAFPVNYEDYGMEKTIAQGIEAAFMPSVEGMLALGKEFESVISGVVENDGDLLTVRPSEESMEQAKELLKKYVKIRTGTSAAHKEQKAPFYQAGKFIDVLKNSQMEASKFYEDQLKAIIDFDKNTEAKRLKDLQERRREAINPYMDGQEHISYSGMPEVLWKQYLKSARDNFENPEKPFDQMEDDMKLLEDFSRFAAPGQPLSKAIEALIHEYLTSTEWKLLRGYVMKETKEA